ncbi:response regulator [Spirosoma migulaei]
MNNRTFCIYALDDDKDDRILIEEALKAYSDCEVTFFEDGKKLLAKLFASPEENLPTLIMLDLDMPRINGYEVLQLLRTTPTFHSIPVLVLSGSEDEKTVFASYQLGANSFISKPSTFAQLDRLFKVICEYWIKTVLTPSTSLIST